MADDSDIGDEHLVAAAQAGDHLAFGKLYDRHADQLYRFAYRLTGNRPDAEDLVADVFLTAWRKRQGFEPSRTSVRPWLFGIARNLARNRWRRQTRGRDALARLHAQRSPDVTIESAGDRLDDAALLSELHDAVSRLPARDRQVFELIVIAELSYGEAAEVLGIPIGTVRSRLARVRSRLRTAERQQ